MTSLAAAYFSSNDEKDHHPQPVTTHFVCVVGPIPLPVVPTFDLPLAASLQHPVDGELAKSDVLFLILTNDPSNDVRSL
jgi:hypothetical protein